MTDHGPEGMTDTPQAGSCDLPEAAASAGVGHHRFDRATFSWEGIPAQVYKRGEAGAFGMGWRDVVRHTLAGGNLAFQLRYFEIAPGGFSSLEKHQHAHAIVVLRGRGTVIAGRDVHAVEPFDLVVVPGGTPHQFVAAGEEPFGFLCPVDAGRDAPQALSPEELRALLAHPQVRAAVRLP